LLGVRIEPISISSISVSRHEYADSKSACAARRRRQAERDAARVQLLAAVAVRTANDQQPKLHQLRRRDQNLRTNSSLILACFPS
jgi:hypothetical protein